MGSKTCRICESRHVARIGSVEYIAGYSSEIWECSSCGCRYTRHDAGVYDLMHRMGAISYYSDYAKLAKACQDCFVRGDKRGLVRLLSGTSKYRFIMDEVAREPADARILEIGSSRGYLTSYLILNGCDVLGVDVCEEAVAHARALYGDHFAVTGDPRIAVRGPYDLIYHVGLIGCVADPVGLTRDLLLLLRPGGRLLFNAPNHGALHLPNQIWLDSAPPPDLVTLFLPGFWASQFPDMAEVREEIELLPRDRALAVWLQRFMRRRWQKPVARDLEASGDHGHIWQNSGRSWHLFERIVLKVGRVTGLARLAPPCCPTDFGLFVRMTRQVSLGRLP